MCRALEDSGEPRDNWLQGQARRLPGGDTVVDSAQDLERTMTRLACDNSNSDLPGYRPGEVVPSPGGLCENVRYNFTVRWDDSAIGPREREYFGFLGPLEGTRIHERSSGDLVLQFGHHTSNNNTYQEAVRWSTVTNNAQRFSNDRLEDIVRADGEPDNCGETTTTNPGYAGPITYNNFDGVEVTVDVDISLDSPIVDEDGNLIIPFVYIDPDLELNPDLELDLEPEINLGEGGCCNRNYGDNLPDFGDNEDDPEDPEQQQRIVGIVVSCDPLSDFATVGEFGDGVSPSIYLPRLGAVTFAVSIGGEGCWLSPIDITVRKQYIPVPGLIPAYTYNVKPVNGWAVEAFPVFLDVPERLVLS